MDVAEIPHLNFIYDSHECFCTDRIADTNYQAECWTYYESLQLIPKTVEWINASFCIDIKNDTDSSCF